MYFVLTILDILVFRADLHLICYDVLVTGLRVRSGRSDVATDDVNRTPSPDSAIDPQALLTKTSRSLDEALLNLLDTRKRKRTEKGIVTIVCISTKTHTSMYLHVPICTDCARHCNSSTHRHTRSRCALALKKKEICFVLIFCR